ncbi:hypothetical protein scyTo_0023839 [Scyliorhinus torazame]|uniref:Uncharacterized protein n=1 Tax=Scyliorhinus torazame TaxID=75743 RepID=A0A401QCY8_SCYTO|nr:hypothetical protein [Scyliorhinus torazame]
MLNSDDDGCDGVSILSVPEEESVLTSLKQGAEELLDCATCCQCETPDKVLQHQVELANGTLEESEAQARVSERTKPPCHFTPEAAHVERNTTEEHGPDSAADDGGERFYDAPEDHADEHRSQGTSSASNKDERSKSQACVSGNFLTQDGFPQVEGSSTDETDMSESPVHCTTRSIETRENRSALGQCDPERDARQLLPSLDIQNQILQLMHNLESDLKHLKVQH